MHFNQPCMDLHLSASNYVLLLNYYYITFQNKSCLCSVVCNVAAASHAALLLSLCLAACVARSGVRVELWGFADSFTTEWSYEVLSDAFLNTFHWLKRFALSHRRKGCSVALIYEKKWKTSKMELWGFGQTPEIYNMWAGGRAFGCI